MAIDLEGDEQDQSEVFDEDNQTLDGEMRTFEDTPDIVDVMDVTSAVGDDDDDEALIAEELDDDAIIALEADQAEEDELGETGFDDDAEMALDEKADDEVELEFTGDLDTLAVDGADSAVMEADDLSDDDLEDLGYLDKAEPAQPGR